MTVFDTAQRPGQAIGLDVGGTKIAGGVINADGLVVDQLEALPSPANDQEKTIDVLTGVIADLRWRHPNVAAVGVGAAGLVEWPQGRIRWAPNNAFHSLPLRQRLQEISGLPTVVDNDANAAAWAEARLGRRSANMAFLTIGTGLGGGFIIDGRLYHGKTGLGAEVGHIIVDPNGNHQCGCGNTGCLEALASGTALERFARAAAAAHPTGMLGTLSARGRRLSGETILGAARVADPTALQLFDQLGYWLGVGVASLVTLFDFELIVVGGGLATADELILAPARESFERFVFARHYRQLPEIVPASLGPEAGWIGAALLAIDGANQATPSRSTARCQPRVVGAGQPGRVD